MPKTEAGEAWDARHPRSRDPNIKYRPYDVYAIFKDSRGHVWFGTSNLGACRYDGSCFAWIGTVDVSLGANDSFGVRSIIEDRDGKFWFTATRNRFAVDPSDTTQRGAVALRYRKEPGLGEEDPVGAFVSAAPATESWPPRQLRRAVPLTAGAAASSRASADRTAPPA